ncbi:MAG: hypothetical protein AAFY56_21165, partial [Pseudomonadota bacterium]
IYDLVAGTMQLTGNVTLTRGDNIVQGTQMDIDLNNDVATVRAESDTKQRVRALFQPGTDSPPAN